MKKIHIGDVFRISTPKGEALIQYIFGNETNCELIRVLPGIYMEEPNDISSIVIAKELFFVYFPLTAAYKKRIVRLIGNFKLPQELELPKQMRSKNVDKDGNLICWHIININTLKRESVKKLTEEHKKLSPWGIWNDSLLIERLVDGWTLDRWI